MIETTLRYLPRSNLYATEKPYEIESETEHSGNFSSVRESNIVTSEQSVTIRKIQPSHKFTLNTNGFCVLNEKTHLDVDKALRNAEEVEAGYLKELGAILIRHFPEYRSLVPLNFVVRKRHEQFLRSYQGVATHLQPVDLAHSDHSVLGATLVVEDALPGQEDYFQNTEFDMINVWRPLVGPNDDWPLALCDYTSIDPKRDPAPWRRVYRDGHIAEHQLPYPNPRHRWFYVKGQQPHDLLVFRNADSTGRRARSFHAAFYNPLADGPPRQSCEARFVAFR